MTGPRSGQTLVGDGDGGSAGASRAPTMVPSPDPHTGENRPPDDLTHLVSPQDCTETYYSEALGAAL